MYLQTMSTEESKPVLYPRSIDHTLWLLKDKHDTYLFLDHIYGHYPSIRYNCKIEENGVVHFLEILMFVVPYIYIF